MTSVNWKQRGTSATRSCRWKYFHILFLFLHFQANFRLRFAFHLSLTFIGRCVTHPVPTDFILIPKEYEGALRSLRSRREMWTRGSRNHPLHHRVGLGCVNTLTPRPQNKVVVCCTVQCCVLHSLWGLSSAMTSSLRDSVHLQEWT